MVLKGEKKDGGEETSAKNPEYLGVTG